MKIFYPRLSAIICQSGDMLKDFNNLLRINPNKLILINNILSIIIFSFHVFKVSLLRMTYYFCCIIKKYTC